MTICIGSYQILSELYRIPLHRDSHSTLLPPCQYDIPWGVPGVASLAQCWGLEQCEVGQVGSLIRPSWLVSSGHLSWTSQSSPVKEQHWPVSTATTSLSSWPTSSLLRRLVILLLLSSCSPASTLSSVQSLVSSCDLLDLKMNMAQWWDHPRWPCHCLCIWCGALQTELGCLARTDPTLAGVWRLTLCIDQPQIFTSVIRLSADRARPACGHTQSWQTCPLPLTVRLICLPYPAILGTAGICPFLQSLHSSYVFTIGEFIKKK